MPWDSNWGSFLRSVLFLDTAKWFLSSLPQIRRDYQACLGQCNVRSNVCHLCLNSQCMIHRTPRLPWRSDRGCWLQPPGPWVRKCGAEASCTLCWAHEVSGLVTQQGGWGDAPRLHRERQVEASHLKPPDSALSVFFFLLADLYL